MVTQRVDATALDELIGAAQVVLDCTDNFDTRQQINDACWRHARALVSGAAIRWEGQVALFDPNTPGSPCYRCLYPSSDATALNCSENGVIAPLVGVIGTCQALEAIKHLAGVGESLAGWILYYDAKYAEWRKLRLAPRTDCPTCGRAD